MSGRGHRSRAATSCSPPSESCSLEVDEASDGFPCVERARTATLGHDAVASLGRIPANSEARPRRTDAARGRLSNATGTGESPHLPFWPVRQDTRWLVMGKLMYPAPPSRPWSRKPAVTRALPEARSTIQYRSGRRGPRSIATSRQAAFDFAVGRVWECAPGTSMRWASLGGRHVSDDCDKREDGQEGRKTRRRCAARCLWQRESGCS